MNKKMKIKVTNEQKKQLIKIAITALIGVLTVFGLYSCTTVLTTTNKGRQQVTIENSTNVSADSASINTNLE